MIRLHGKGPVREALWWLAVPLTLLIGIALSSVVAEQSSRRTRLALTLPRERELAKQAGLPLTPAELPPRKPVRPEENAAPLYLKIYEQWEIENPENPLPDIEPVISYMSPTTRNARNRVQTQRLLKQAAPQLSLAEEASRRPVMDLPPFWEEEEYREEANWKFVLPACRRLGVFMAARAIQENNAGDPMRALRTLATGRRIAAHMAGHGVLRRPLYGMGVVDNLHLALQDVIRRNPDKPAVLKQADRLCADLRPDLRTLRQEIPLNAVAYAAQADEWRRRPYKPEDTQPLLNINRFWRALDELEFTLRYKEAADAYEAAHLSYLRRATDMLKAAREADVRAQRRALERLDEAERKRRLPLPSSYRPPLLSRTAARILLQETMLVISQAVIAIAQERKRTGRVPERLPARIPLDPYSGKPLRWRRDAKGGWLLYSVGPNERDDGGILTRKGQEQHGPVQDIVITIGWR